MPRAVPRRFGANQRMIVLGPPVAANAAPMLATKKRTASTGKLVEKDAANIASPPPPTPIVMIVRSLKRSLNTPPGSNPIAMPPMRAAESNPNAAWLMPRSVSSSGPRTPGTV